MRCARFPILGLVLVGLILASLILAGCEGETPASPAPTTTLPAANNPFTPLPAASITPARTSTLNPTPTAGSSSGSGIEAGLTARGATGGITATPALATSPVTLLLTFDNTAHPLSAPISMALDPQGNAFVVDHGSSEIVKFDKNGHFVKAWGSKGTADGQFQLTPPVVNGGPDAGFITVDQKGQVYVSDGYNLRIQVFDNDGKFLFKFGSMGSGDGQFSPPVLGSITLDKDGNFIVTDFEKVQKFDPKGNFLKRWGSAGSGDGQFKGAASPVQDSRGNIYVADLLNSRVQKFDPNWNFVAKWEARGLGDGQFDQPVGMAIDSKDHIFVTDNTTRVQIFDTQGKFLGKWESPEPGQPKFSPGTVTVDSLDNIYVVTCSCRSPVPAVYKFRLK